ncbi:MAG: cobalamin B12-binding domain-containing protein [Syntrophaceticus sp.]|jgi:methylmalonyl-CoA mutase cobalamin-binding domain/chain
MAEKLVKALTELKEKEVLDMVQELLESGKKPMEIVDSSRIAMEEVGKRFESGEYFIPDLIFAGEILKRVSEIVKPEMEEEAGAEKIGKVIIGTVEGDIHDIGKNIVTFMMDINGFEVIDLGVDVPPEKYVEAIRENDVKVVGLSGLLTLAYDSMKNTVETIKEAGLNDVKIMIGGSIINEDVVAYTGADAYGADPMAGISLAKKWLGL